MGDIVKHGMMKIGRQGWKKGAKTGSGGLRPTAGFWGRGADQAGEGEGADKLVAEWYDEVKMPLELELESFARMKEQLLVAHPGKFALIHGSEFVGAFDTTENAYNEGVSKFGRDPFLVKRIQTSDGRFRNFAYTSGLMRARI